MAQNVIAIICDCDGTLCPDTTNKLVVDLGIDSVKFWRDDVNPLVEDGWDPPLAYLNKLIAVMRGQLSKPTLKKIGESVEFFPGALDFMVRLRDQLNEEDNYRNAGLTIEWYIVSSGIGDILRATQLGESTDEIYACEFEFGNDGVATTVKRSVSFTEKTKFIYAINKGINGDRLRMKPYSVNDAVDDEDRRVPFTNMIYVGDGPSDIPCFSMIKRFGGQAIGVWPPQNSDLRKPYELAEGDRLTLGPYAADYSDGSDLFKMLETSVKHIAVSILVKQSQKIRPAPGH